MKKRVSWMRLALLIVALALLVGIFAPAGDADKRNLPVGVEASAEAREVTPPTAPLARTTIEEESVEVVRHR